MGKITELAAEKLLKVMQKNSLDPAVFGFRIGLNDDALTVDFTKDLEFEDFEDHYGLKIYFETGLEDLCVDFEQRGLKSGFVFLRS